MNIQKYQFNNEEIQISTDEKGEPWFIAKEICNLLEIKNNRDAMSRIYDDDKVVGTTDTPGGMQKCTYINEFGFYDLVLLSKSDKAKVVKKWITHEVLPSIRKTGSYGIKELSKDERLEQLAQGTLELLQIKQQLETKIEQDKPKVKLHDAIMDTNDTLSIKEMAKLLGTGQNRLFAWLRAEGYLMSNNLPYQPYLDRGYFIPKEMPLHKGDKSEIYLQTRVTTKGQVWLSNKYN